MRARDISPISQLLPSSFSSVKVREGRSPTLKLPSALPAPATFVIATFTPGEFSPRVRTVGVGGGIVDPGAPSLPSLPSLPLQAPRSAAAAIDSANRPDIGNGVWEIFTASLHATRW